MADSTNPMEIMLQEMRGQMNQQSQMIHYLQNKLEEQQQMNRVSGHSLETSTKEKLPKLREFSGSRADFDQWKLAAKHKLEADGAAIGTHMAQFRYLYSRLTGDAAKTVLARAEAFTREESGSGQSFLEYLETIYGDPNKMSRAMQTLLNMKQGERESFSTFLPRFETTLANAGASSLPDMQKISMLKNALNKELRYQLVSVHNRVHHWGTYISEVQTINSELEALHHNNRKTFTPPHGHQQHQSSSTMEWEHTPPIPHVNAASAKEATGKRATWVSKATIQFRRERGLCLRCGNKGHLVRECKFLSPHNPDLKVNSVKSRELETEEELSAAQADSMEEPGKVQLL